METITLTLEEQQRIEVIQRVFRRELTMAEGIALLLSLEYSDEPTPGKWLAG